MATDELRGELGDAGLSAARGRLDRRLEAAGEAAAPPHPRPATRRGWSRHRLRLATAVGACIALGAVALATLPDGSGRLSALDAAAAVAARQPAAAAGGNYAYLRVRYETRLKPPLPVEFPEAPSTTQELWVRADGSGRIATGSGQRARRTSASVPAASKTPFAT